MNIQIFVGENYHYFYKLYYFKFIKIFKMHIYRLCFNSVEHLCNQTQRNKYTVDRDTSYAGNKIRITECHNLVCVPKFDLSHQMIAKGT